MNKDLSFRRVSRTLQMVLPAAALVIGLAANVPTASANDTNPLLKSSAGVVTLNQNQMDGVQGSGPWANFWGASGVSYALSAYNVGRYARYTAPTNSAAEYNNYAAASNYAHKAGQYFSQAYAASYLGR